MISRYDSNTKKIKHFSVNSCLYPLGMVEGCAVTTIEALGSSTKGLHPIQERFFKGHASQCGNFITFLFALFYSILNG